MAAVVTGLAIGVSQAGVDHVTLARLAAVAPTTGQVQEVLAPAVHQAWGEVAVADEAEAGDVDRRRMRIEDMHLNKLHAIGLHSVCLSVLVMGYCITLVTAAAQPDNQASTNPFAFQQWYISPENAAQALITATTDYNVSALLQIFGPAGKDFVSSADPVRDKNTALAFAAKAREKHKVFIDPKDGAKAILTVGEDDWPFPVPLVARGNRWYFDSQRGRREILLRRIGANELDAIKICHGFVEAQKEYASDIHDDSGVNQYAQKLISTPGKHDGLYWENPDGSAGGPISKAVAQAIQEGYSTDNPSGYHGYYFKVLTGQGPAAPLGELDYEIEGAMIGGFALLAVPVEYRVTGVKTFIVSYDGVVYEKDLGPDTLNLAKNIDRYNPDKTWHRSNAHWPDDTETSED